MRIISSENKTINESKGCSNRSLLYYLFVGGLLAALFVAPFLRGLYFEQELLPIIMLVALSFVCCVGEWFFQRDEPIFNHPLDWAMLALVMVYLLSLINAVHIHQALLALLTVSVFFMVYFMAGRAIKNGTDYSRLLLVAYLAGIGLALAGLGAAAGFINMPAAYEDGHIRSAVQYHNTLAIYLAGLSFAGLALGLATKWSISRMAYAAGNLLMVIVMVGAISRGTWILYPLGCICFIFLISKQYRREALLNWAMFFPYGLVAGLGFLNNISQGHKISALSFILAGLLIALFMQWLADLNKQTPKPDEDNRKHWLKGWPQLLSIGLVLMLGLLYMLLSSPAGSARIVPQEITAKVEKTSLQDNSINDRLTFYQDALKIAVDYPVIGAGGGGWEALYHSYAQRLYWSREVHSYYLQTLVEAGVLGLLALLVMAVLFIKSLVDFRQQYGDGKLSHAILWGGAVALIMIGMHAGFDADFSLPSTGVLFYALLGGMKGYMIKETRSGSERKKSKRESNKTSAGDRTLITAAFGLTIALLVFARAGALCRASQLGEAGAQALEAREVDRASSFYQRAAKLDPWRATYQINLAQIEAIKSDKYGKAEAHQAAKDYAARAVELEPYNSKVHRALIDIYGMLHEGDLRIAESEALVKSNPLFEQSYEILAGNNMEAGWYFLQSGQRKQADIYFARVIDIREKLPSGAGQPEPGLNLRAGQASICLGKPEEGQKILEQVLKAENEDGASARLWLAVAAALEGDSTAADLYLKQLSAQDKEAPAKYQSIIQLLNSKSRVPIQP